MRDLIPQPGPHPASALSLASRPHLIIKVTGAGVSGGGIGQPLLKRVAFLSGLGSSAIRPAAARLAALSENYRTIGYLDWKRSLDFFLPVGVTVIFLRLAVKSNAWRSRLWISPYWKKKLVQCFEETKRPSLRDLYTVISDNCNDNSNNYYSIYCQKEIM